MKKFRCTVPYKRYQAMGNDAMCQTLNGKLQKLLTKQPAM